MKKYQLGALTVSDKGLQDTKEEIVIELIDRMQKYVAEGKSSIRKQGIHRRTEVEHHHKSLWAAFAGLPNSCKSQWELTFGGRTGFFTRKKCSIIFTTGK